MMGDTTFILKWASAILFVISLGFFVRDMQWGIPFAIASVILAFIIDEERGK